MLNNKIEDLSNQIRLVKRSLQCPNCGGPTGDLSQKEKFKCEYCQQIFAVSKIDKNSSEDVSWKKLQEIAKLHLEMMNEIMRSQNDIQFDPKRFIPRKDATNTLDNFLKNHSLNKRLFILLGEAGFGKTWLMLHYANSIIKQGYPVFLVCLRDGLENFFNNTFDSSWQETRNDIQKMPVQKQDNNKPIIWIMDGYDEIIDDNEKRLLLIQFLKFIEKNQNQLLIITSRAFNWYKCDVATDQELRISRLIWSTTHETNVSFELQAYNKEESKLAISRYGLPDPEKHPWPPELLKLAKFPLWIRIISEIHNENNKIMPKSLTRTIYDKYFKRMGLKKQHVNTLVTISMKLLESNHDLNGELILDDNVNIDTKTLVKLNSSGIFHYKENIYESSIQLFTTAFGWYGIVYKCFQLNRAKKQQELAKIFAIIKKLPKIYEKPITALLSEFKIPLASPNQKKFNETQQLLENARMQMNERS
ncbi:MAG: hypothetical protein ACTSXP_16100 [Promethearchaeota archaeon]